MKRNTYHRAVANRFSAAAETYDDHAHVQRDVAAELMTSSPDLRDDARVLEAGCGTGHLTALLAERYPSASIDAFDASPRMIAVARKRLADTTSVSWHTATIETFQPGRPYDLVISSAALHWVQPLPPALQTLARCVRPRGHFVAALMVEGTLPELMAARARVAPGKEPRAVLPGVETAKQAFAKCALEELTFRSRRFSEHHPSARVFLRSLHAAGLTGGAGSPAAPPLGRSELERLAEDYEAHYREPEGVRATYEVLLVGARRAPSSGSGRND